MGLYPFNSEETKVSNSFGTNCPEMDIITVKEALKITQEEFDKGYLESFLGREKTSKTYSYGKGYKKGQKEREELKGGL